jgi:hypothetical protein
VIRSAALSSIAFATPKAVAGVMVLSAGIVLAAVGAFAAPPPKAPGDGIVMAAHRAVYDLSLSSTEGAKGVDSARGRIVFEFTGTACEGYALNFRQVTELSGGDIGTRVSDIRSTTFEDGDGSQLRFNSDSRYPPARTELTDGSALRKNGKVSIKLKKPTASSIDLSGDVLFPTAHMRKLIVAAKGGQSTVNAKVFDGSEKGRKPYETFAVIGRPIDLASHPADDVLVKLGWDRLQRWPVSVSYFDEGQVDSEPPLYVISFELLENGVSRKLKLNYGDFALNGDLKVLEALSAGTCSR